MAEKFYKSDPSPEITFVGKEWRDQVSSNNRCWRR